MHITYALFSVFFTKLLRALTTTNSQQILHRIISPYGSYFMAVEGRNHIITEAIEELRALFVRQRDIHMPRLFGTNTILRIIQPTILIVPTSRETRTPIGKC